MTGAAAGKSPGACAAGHRKEMSMTAVPFSPRGGGGHQAQETSDGPKAARMKPVPTPGQKAELRVLRQLTDAQFKN